MDKQIGSTPSPQPHDPLAGRVLDGRFRLVEMIAKGGMGQVYRAQQAPLDREVAVKVLELSDSVEDDGQFRSRFFREAKICAQLSHPNTVRVFDYGQDGDTYFLVMEMLRGQTLHRLVKQGGPLQPVRAVRMARQICRSLAQAHELGVIHRDLKPANIFVLDHDPDHDEDFVKVLDFGLVKPMDAGTQVTRAGNILGSPAYMAPEQVMGETVSPATDVYSLGCCLYVMLTRELPFRRDHPMAVLNAQVNAPRPTLADALPDRDWPESLEWVIARSLEKLPENRFASMRELERALKRVERELQGHGDALPMELDAGRLVAEGLDQDSMASNAPQPIKRAELAAQPTLALGDTGAESSQERSAVGEFAIGLGAAGAVVGLLALVAVGAGVWWWSTQRPTDPAPVAQPQPALRSPASEVTRPQTAPVVAAQPAAEPATEPVIEPAAEPAPAAPDAQAGAGSETPSRTSPVGTRAEKQGGAAAPAVTNPEAETVSPEAAGTQTPSSPSSEPSAGTQEDPTPTTQPAAEPKQDKPNELRDPWGSP
ncbi:MAG: protein kinase [Myxococcota bacterium]|nr:protein kinase [Myxococcota bacterium]